MPSSAQHAACQMEKELPLPRTSCSSASASPSLMASISRSCSSVEYLAGSSVFCKWSWYKRSICHHITRSQSAARKTSATTEASDGGHAHLPCHSAQTGQGNGPLNSLAALSAAPRQPCAAPHRVRASYCHAHTGLHCIRGAVALSALPSLPQDEHLDGAPVLIIWTALSTCMACRVLASARLNSLASSGFLAYPTCLAGNLCCMG